MTTTRSSSSEQMPVRRFDVHQRIQHVLMMTTFTILALTGLPLKFSDWAISQWWLEVWGGIDTTRAIHQYAAWVMLGDGAYHVLYIAISTLVFKKPFPISMVPTPRDFSDFFQELGYFIGISRDRPRFGRFSWREKFDYWAVFWGIAIMGGSGLILMYPVLATNFFPGWLVPVALVSHSDEAVLAVSWIVIVHLFFSHLAPGVFPINTSIFTGKVPRERYKTEHPLDTERLEEEAVVATSQAEAKREQSSG